MWINLARVYETMGNYTESEKCYEYILKNIDSNDFLAKFNLSLLWLKKGNFKNGLKNFEFRFDNPLYWKRRFTKWPLLKNLKIIKDKKVLVWMEGGLGDTILFCRYVEKLLELGAHVTYEVPPSLINIIKTLNSKIKYVSSKISISPLCCNCKTSPCEIFAEVEDNNFNISRSPSSTIISKHLLSK